eukprot:TRINITY_DN1247_c0_g1_i1.p2 TRINITY_DN1247_c0_g1~~TRINITY_DN1247_c0_g1_i1.p2  ORF type:complete len:217 (-),score=81.11 TRINITY_DN1247_c0_g1_i1:78-728(-)
MADQQQADPRVEQIKALFLPHDPQQTGAIPATAFQQVLGQSGFNISDAKLLRNLQSLVDVQGTGNIDFGGFLWLHGLLGAIAASFNPKAQNGAIPVGAVPQTLGELNYKFPDATNRSLSVMADPTHSGWVGFEAFVKVIAFISFAWNRFAAADQAQKGSLTFEAFKTELPWLGIAAASDDQARSIFNKFDTDHSNSIEFPEFVATVLAMKFPELAN